MAIGQINLVNMFRTYCAAPKKDRPDHVKRFARVALTANKEMPAEYELARPDLRARLWTRSGQELQRLRGLAGGSPLKGAELVAIPVGSHLVASFAYDWPDSVQSVSPDWLETWDVTPYRALEDAILNLAEATEGYAAIGTSLYTFVTGDSYDATRILLTGMIEGMEVLGQHVAMTPNRNTPMITGAEDEEGLRMMADLAEEALGGEYPLIGMPMVLEDGAWADWLPPAGHPLRRRFGEMQMRWIGPAYAEQKELLDALHARTARDVHAASFSVVERVDDGGLVCYCVWGEGVTSLLPETNKVVLIGAGGDDPAALTDWERVVEVAGHLLEETGDYPRRWRTLGFPDDAALEAIGPGDL